MSESTRQCGVPDCLKGGTHRKPYLATACQLYNINHRTVVLPDGSVKTVPRKGSVVRAFGGQAPAREAAVEIVAAEPRIGTLKELKATAKALKIRCRAWMSRPELEEAVECATKGNIGRLEELVTAARARSQEAWAAWRSKQVAIEVKPCSGVETNECDRQNHRIVV